MKYVVTDGEKRVSVWKDMIAGAHMFNEAEVRAVLLEIGNCIGFGRAQQILGEEWDREHNCAPRGRMGVTIKDESFAQTLGEPVAWRYRHPDEPNGWCVVLSNARANALASTGLVVEPLYAAPYHPTTEKGCE